MSLIQINCNTPNSEIYYSINNENLNIKYTEPFHINESSTIYAIGRREGWEESNISNKECIKLPTPQVEEVEVLNYKLSLCLMNIEDYSIYVDDTQENLIFSCKLGTGELSTKTYKEVLEDEYHILYTTYIWNPDLGNSYTFTVSGNNYLTSDSTTLSP